MKKLFVIAAFLLTLTISVFAKDNYERIDIKIGKSLNSGSKLELESKDDLDIYTSDFQPLHKTNNKKLKIEFKNEEINLYGNNYAMKKFPKDGTFVIYSKSPIKVSSVKRSYRGVISFRINDKKLDVINNIDMDNYLRGVLPKEMSPSFPLESLKAQALCSRSFAINNYNKFIKKGYNLDDTTNSQVYRGVDVEDKRTDKAIEETKGEIVMYNGKVAETIFGASSGGFTASAKDVWGSDIPYLVSVEDNFSTYNWEYKLTPQNFSKLGVKNIDNIIVTSKDNSNRVKEVKVLSSDGEKTLTGNKFRSLVGNTSVKSTLFDIEKNGENILVKGKGYGHGVGMSQYGAVEMAKQGKVYRDIIGFYFPGTVIEKN